MRGVNTDKFVPQQTRNSYIIYLHSLYSLWFVNQSMKHQNVSRSPWIFIPTLYFAEGVPNVLISAVSVLIYKDLGVDNAQITAWTSLLYLPWVIKMFWGPIVDIYSTKRTWILTMQFAMFCCLTLVALSLQLPNFFFISLAALTLGAFISATYDIATDGFYMLALNSEQQAFFVGIRSLFYRLAVLFGNGFLVVLAGRLQKSINNIPLSWTITIGFSALMFAILFVFHRFVLPSPESNVQKVKLKAKSENINFVQVFSSYFQQNKIGAILAFILLYRLGEAMLVKMAPIFLKDKIELGGLGLSIEDIGWVSGTFGVISLIAGGILGGILVARYGLKKSLWPMVLSIHLPNLVYVYMAYTQPQVDCFMSFVLGIDGGGSKTVCVLMDDKYQVIGRGEAGASNYQSIGIKAAQESIKVAINAAKIEALKITDTIIIEAICLGLAGVGRSADIEVVKGIVEYLQNSKFLPITWALHPSNIVICHDALISLVGGIGDDIGIVVAAGTGSIVFGRNYQGETKRVGGWGYLLGDEGSAYKIAVAGMQAALKAYDGREISTRIVEDFKQHLGLTSIEDLIEVIYRRGWGVKEIAALAPIVDNAAAAGDEVANNIIDDAVQELVKATSTVMNTIFTQNLTSNPSDIKSFSLSSPRFRGSEGNAKRGTIIEVVTTGSVWQGRCNIRERFAASVVRKFSLVKVILPRYEPAYGAALLALKSLVIPL